VVESQPSKLLVAGSIPVSRSKDLSHEAPLLCESRPDDGGCGQMVPPCRLEPEALGASEASTPM
jgi:hypothetical protein